ncbi:MAG: carboxypeptidase regulatory-like domain-containing protein [Acidobacteriota bacterium]
MLRVCLLSLLLGLARLTYPNLAVASDPVAEARLGGDPTGIAGRVTQATDGSGVAIANVNIYDTDKNLVVAWNSDNDGDFLVSGLDPGTYFAAAGPSPFSANLVLGQVFDGMDCPTRFLESCDFSLATAIEVTAGAVITGVDFSLPRGATITGRVLDAGSGEPVEQAFIRILDEEGQSQRVAGTDVAGRYRALGLGAGRVFAQAEGGIDGNHGAEAYPGIPCAGSCEPTDGDLIEVDINELINGIDFTLPPLGRLRGTVVDEFGIPFRSAGITVFDEGGQFLDSKQIDYFGSYLFQGLTSGSYRVQADGPVGIIREAYDDIACEPSCSSTAGDLIPIVEGQTTGGIDLRLAERGHLSGTVHDQLTGSGLNAVVMIFDAAGSLFDSTDSADSTFGMALPEGQYFAVASTDGYVPQLFASIACPGAPIPACDPTTGTPIDVKPGILTAAVDFGLVPLAKAGGTHLRGRVLDADSDQSVGGATVHLWRSNGTLLDSTPSSPLGAFQFSDLTPGTYFATAENGDDHKPGLFEDLPCSGPGFPGCDPTTGTPITVILDETTDGVDMALEPRGKIAGKVTQQANDLPLEAAEIVLFNSDGVEVARSPSDETGAFEIARRAGTYFAMASRERFETELFDSRSCVNQVCDPTEGTPLIVPETGVVANVDFALRRQGAITGRLFGRSTGEALGFSIVRAFDSAGEQVDTVSTDQTGIFRLNLDPGTYTIGGLDPRYMTEIFDGIPCPNFDCDRTQGTPLVVAPATETVVDLTPPIAQGIAGRVIDAETKEPLAGIIVDLWDPALNVLKSTLTFPDGTYALYRGAGEYHVSTDNFLGFEHKVFDDISCPLGSAFEEKCDPRLGSLLEIQSSKPTVHQVDFALRRVEVFNDGFESGTTDNWSSTVPATP